jgi:sulfur carrier protein ThiS
MEDLKVKDLIEILEKLDQNAIVEVEGEVYSYSIKKVEEYNMTKIDGIVRYVSLKIED